MKTIRTKETAAVLTLIAVAIVASQPLSTWMIDISTALGVFALVCVWQGIFRLSLWPNLILWIAFHRVIGLLSALRSCLFDSLPSHGALPYGIQIVLIDMAGKVSMIEILILYIGGGLLYYLSHYSAAKRYRDISNHMMLDTLPGLRTSLDMELAWQPSRLSEGIKWTRRYDEVEIWARHVELTGSLLSLERIFVIILPAFTASALMIRGYYADDHHMVIRIIGALSLGMTGMLLSAMAALVLRINATKCVDSDFATLNWPLSII